MRKLTLVGSAVAAALTAAVATPAYAIAPSALPTFDVSLTVSGASALRDAFQNQMISICSTSTALADRIDVYSISTSGTHPDFRAYTCTLDNDAGTLAGKKAVVYYRSEGGSVYGPAPIAKGIQLLRLKISSSCTATTTTNVTISGVTYTVNRVTCPSALPVTFNLNADTGDASLFEKATTELGVSDVEAEAFTGENWPVGSVFGGTPLTATERANLTGTPVQAQAFMLIASSGLPAALTAISRADAAAIFTGSYTDWSQVAGSGATGTIHLCRRTAGSGTQTAASIFFNNTYCASTARPAVGPFKTAPNTTLSEASSDLDACVSSRTNAIGFRSLTGTAPAGTRILNLGTAGTGNAVAPTRTNAATNAYEWWYEAYEYKGPGFSSLPADTQTLANALIDRQKDNTTAVPSANTFSILGLGLSENPPVVPVSATNPIGIATRGGAVCPIAVNGN